jgi:hypothetical protein
MKNLSILVIFFCCIQLCGAQHEQSWIRINLLGYPAKATKVAVLVSKKKKGEVFNSWQILDAQSDRVIQSFTNLENFDAYGPFLHVTRLDFSSLNKQGLYYIKAGSCNSPVFKISDQAYKGAADFSLQYMRQQRSGYNPYLKDSCHVHDGFTVYGPMPDGTKVDVAGGWHDASDYLQYATTSANATYQLLAAYRDFKAVFSDQYQKNGLAGKNGMADVLDEAKWGLDWLLKMHPREDWLFNQIADDRDHAGMRLPTRDSVDYGYGPGKGRPVYFANGLPQGLEKYKSRATGVASIAAKFTSAFALGAQLFKDKDAQLATLFENRSLSSYTIGLNKPGVQQTACNKAPYFYEEDNWIDDMELGAAALYQLTLDTKFASQAFDYALKEPVTPWMITDTARHYQWYPFHNFGHYELALNMAGNQKSQLIGFYKEGIEKVWNRARQNGFYRGIPFIWCSNNLTTSFAIQCYLYRKLSGDTTYQALEQACFDWLFGVNPWGTSMIVGYPRGADHPTDPHSSFTHLYQYPVKGGLVDGPIYGSIYGKLLGIKLYNPDIYSEFQSKLAVYHDDYGDYSTNEPTMDGTASLIYLLAAKEYEYAKEEAKNK